MHFTGLLPMTTKYTTALAVLLLALLCAGCGDIFRPVANPIPGPPPDPQNFHFAIVASQNAPGNPGSGMQIDVSGDSNVGAVQAGSLGVVSPGQGPVHAAILPPNAARVYVANGMDDTVSTFTPASIIGSIGGASTITLPAGSDPIFLHTTQSQVMYVANYGVLPSSSPICPSTSTVAAISTASEVVTNFVCVGLHPSVLAESPNAQKLYSVNGDGTISSINPVDLSVNPPIPSSAFSAAPVWAVTSLDNSALFVLDQTGTVSAFATFNDALVAATNPGLATPDANFLFLDRHLNRLYATNPRNNTVTIFDASTTSVNPAAPHGPRLMTTLAMPATATNPVMVTALNDGTQAYVVSEQTVPSTSPTTLNWQVTAIRTSDDTVIGGQPIASGTVDLTSADPGALALCSNARFRTAIASSQDSSKVYVTVCDAGTTNIIRTSNNTLVVAVNSPVSAYVSSTVTISAVAVSGSSSTYSYSLSSGSSLRVGMAMNISGMSDSANNGTFIIASLGSGTFTVTNPSAVSATGQAGIGIASPPPQNPVWVVAGP
jgi:hypothetical protein